ALLLKQFLSAEQGITENVETTEGTFTHRAAASFKVDPPTAVERYTFKAGSAPACRYEVHFDRQTVVIYLPQQLPGAAGHQISVEDVAKGLAALPGWMRAAQQVVVIEPTVRAADVSSNGGPSELGRSVSADAPFALRIEGTATADIDQLTADMIQT